MSNKYPSCGFEKEYADKPLCFNCYHRGTTGALKMMVLDIFDKASERLTTDELRKNSMDCQIWKKNYQRYT
jgi:hypothetical protein